jgi:hypothetical protein
MISNLVQNKNIGEVTDENDLLLSTIMANFLPSYLIKQSLKTLNDGYSTQLRLKLGEIYLKEMLQWKTGSLNLVLLSQDIRIPLAMAK